MKALLLTCISCLFLITYVYAQVNVFQQVYPIGENPNIGYKTSMVPEIEQMIFEANPILRMPLYNNFRQKLVDNSAANVGSALYFNFRPQIRMYNAASKPIKMPSYKIGILGFQQLIRLKAGTWASDHFLALAVESGHYSNGQSGSAFDSRLEDGSEASNVIYRSITPDSDLSAMLNRTNGNFSTNYTEVFLKYKKMLGSLDDNYVPLSELSLQLGYTLYHNNLLFLADIGGYSADDIKIYGKNRFHLALAYMNRLGDRSFIKQKLRADRYIVDVKTVYIATPHASVNPFRIDLTGTVYFKNNVGLFVSGIYGHDDYNFRFVDSGKQLFVGMTFDIFPPMEVR